MNNKPDLLVKENITRHLSDKIKLLEKIKKVSSNEDEPLILQSLLATIVSLFEAALLDTVREYVYARPDEIRDLLLDELQKSGKKKFDKNKIKEIGFDNYMIEDFIEGVSFGDIRDKIKQLKELTGIEVDLGNERWEWIIETIARRNCFIHNDLIANNIYFSQAGQKAEDIDNGKKIEITKSYLSKRIGYFQSLLEEIKEKLELVFKDKDNVAAVKQLWDYIFGNKRPFLFDKCWDISGKNLMSYKGAKAERTGRFRVSKNYRTIHSMDVIF